MSYITTLKVREDYNFELKFEGVSSLNNYNLENFEENPWLVFRHSFTNVMKVYKRLIKSFKIKQGDEIKFGKVQFKVREINLNNNDSVVKEKEFKLNYNMKKNLHISLDATNITKIKYFPKKKSTLGCRICLCEDNELNNPLICPCKCSGTMKYIHLQCLKTWLKSKLNSKECYHLTIYSFPSIECELCLGIIPELIMVKGEYYSLIEFNRPTTNYLMLENIEKFDEKEIKNIFLIDMKGVEKLNIGRANSCDIKINDISVSRIHAKLKIINNQFYIEDNNSKFGTHMKIDHNFRILPNKQLGVQIGKYLITFNLNKTLCSYFSCYWFKENKFSDYNDYLDKTNTNKIEIIEDIRNLSSQQSSNYESKNKENDNDNPKNIEDKFLNKNSQNTINKNIKIENINKFNLGIVQQPNNIKVNYHDNASSDDTLINPSSDNSQRNLIRDKINHSINNTIDKTGIFCKNSKNIFEKEIDIKDLELISKPKCVISNDLTQNENISNNEYIFDKTQLGEIKLNNYNSEKYKIKKDSPIQKDIQCLSEHNKDGYFKSNISNFINNKVIKNVKRDFLILKNNFNNKIENNLNNDLPEENIINSDEYNSMKMRNQSNKKMNEIDFQERSPKTNKIIQIDFREYKEDKIRNSIQFYQENNDILKNNIDYKSINKEDFIIRECNKNDIDEKMNSVQLDKFDKSSNVHIKVDELSIFDKNNNQLENTIFYTEENFKKTHLKSSKKSNDFMFLTDINKENFSSLK